MGTEVGRNVGTCVGQMEGRKVGILVGTSLGIGVGSMVGNKVGTEVGNAVGSAVGLWVSTQNPQYIYDDTFWKSLKICLKKKVISEIDKLFRVVVVDVDLYHCTNPLAVVSIQKLRL